MSNYRVRRINNELTVNGKKPKTFDYADSSPWKRSISFIENFRFKTLLRKLDVLKTFSKQSESQPIEQRKPYLKILEGLCSESMINFISQHLSLSKQISLLSPKLLVFSWWDARMPRPLSHKISRLNPPSNSPLSIHMLPSQQIMKCFLTGWWIDVASCDMYSPPHFNTTTYK